MFARIVRLSRFAHLSCFAHLSRFAHISLVVRQSLKQSGPRTYEEPLMVSDVALFD